MRNHKAAEEEAGVWLTVGVLVALSTAVVCYSVARPTVQPRPAEKPPELLGVWDAKVVPRLRETEEASHAAALAQAELIGAFLKERKGRTREFAEAVLSLRGKWNFVAGKLPWAEEGRHERYLQEQFASIVFSPDELRAVITAAVDGYLTRAEGLENQLLVDLRQDLADSELPSGQPLPDTLEAFRGEYQRLVQAVVPILQRDLGVAVGKGVVNLIGTDIAAIITLRVTTACVSRLGLSGGILGAGAVSGTATLGVGLAVGFLIDRALDSLLRLGGYDPEAKIAAEVNRTLDQLRTLIVDGDAGLRRELEQLHTDRTRIREAALHKLIVEGDQ